MTQDWVSLHLVVLTNKPVLTTIQAACMDQAWEDMEEWEVWEEWEAWVDMGAWEWEEWAWEECTEEWEECTEEE